MRKQHTPQTDFALDRRAFVRSVGIGGVVPVSGFRGGIRMDEPAGIERTRGQTAESSERRPEHRLDLTGVAARYSIPSALVRVGS